MNKVPGKLPFKMGQNFNIKRSDLTRWYTEKISISVVECDGNITTLYSSVILNEDEIYSHFYFYILITKNKYKIMIEKTNEGNRYFLPVPGGIVREYFSNGNIYDANEMIERYFFRKYSIMDE